MILLSFDTEEFDLPREHGVEISLKDGMKVSAEGTCRVLDILRRNGVRATFFCTTNFAENAPEVMQRIVSEGHEVASHGVDHFQPQESDIKQSKQILERITGQEIGGYRHPRMLSVNNDAIEEAGYRYNSSLHPAFIPGRYMHLSEPRTPFYRGRVLEVPTSVSPWFRLPVFWLACHHYPTWLYRKLCLWTLHHDGQFVIYFHPWEFINLRKHPEWNIPYIISRNTGETMEKRLEMLIQTFKNDGVPFATYSEFTLAYEKSHNSSSSL